MAFSKVASKSWTDAVELVGDKDVFSFRGPAVAKLASDRTKFLSKADAEFMGVAMGVSPEHMKKAMALTANGEPACVAGVKKLVEPREKLASARAKVKGYLSDLEVPIHNYCLVKEAAMLDDALTADKILGLGLLNAENVSSFVDMLPSLDAASSKLAELLVAVRLGLKDVPEAAVERMLRSLEDVIRGLKSLHQNELTESAAM
jgi:hypothetical protein